MNSKTKRMIAYALAWVMIFTTFFSSMTPIQVQAAGLSEDVIDVVETVEVVEETGDDLEAQEVTIPSEWARLVPGSNNSNGHFGSEKPELFLLSGNADIKDEALSFTLRIMSAPEDTRARLVTKYVDDTHWGYLALEPSEGEYYSWGFEYNNGGTNGWPTISGLPQIRQYDVFNVQTAYVKSGDSITGMTVTVNNLTSKESGSVTIDAATVDVYGNPYSNFTDLGNMAGKVGVGAGYYVMSSGDIDITDLLTAGVQTGDTYPSSYSYYRDIEGQSWTNVSNAAIEEEIANAGGGVTPDPEPEPEPEPAPDPNPNDDITREEGTGRAWWTLNAGPNNSNGHAYGDASTAAPVVLLDNDKVMADAGELSMVIKPNANWGIFYSYVDDSNWLYVGKDGSSGWYYQYKLNGSESYPKISGLPTPTEGEEMAVSISLSRETLSITVDGTTVRVTNKTLIDWANQNAGKGRFGVKTNGSGTSIRFADVKYNGADCMNDTWVFAASRAGQSARLEYAPTATVTGVVTDTEGVAVKNAIVRIGSQFVKTDEQGSFAFEGVELGTQTVTVSKGGYEAYVDEAVEVTEGGCNLTIQITAKQAINLDNYDIIESDDMKVYVGKNFPLVARYQMKNEGAFFRGNETNLNTISISGNEIVPTVEKTYFVENEEKTNIAKVYELSLKDEEAKIDLTMTVQISVADNTLTWEVTELEKADGCARIATIDIPGLNLLTVDNAEEEAVFAGAQVSTTTTVKADHYITFEEGFTPMDKDGYLYAFLSNGDLSAGLFSNSEAEGDKRVVRYNGADNIGLSSAPWYYEMGDKNGTSGMLGNETKYPSYPVSELPVAKVAIAGDVNNDGDIDWNDGALAYRDIMHYAYGSENIKDMVNYRIVMNFASMAPNPFLATADNIKKVYLATDGLPQSVMLKGYGNEGHDSANSEYADIAVREGGVEDFQDLIKIAHKYNTEIGIHVNAQEIYPEAKSMNNTMVSYPNVSNGWGWLDQSHVIDKLWDLSSQARWKRFVQLYDRINNTKHLNIEWPNAVKEGTDVTVDMTKEQLKAEAESKLDNMDFIYLDVWYQDAWETRRIAEEINSLGWRFSTEFSAEGEYDSTWQHWSTDAQYGGAGAKGYNSDIIRFIRNDQRDSQVLNHPKFCGTANNPLLGGYRLYGFEGWGGDRDFDNYILQTFNQNLPTRFFQHYIITDWTNYEEGQAPMIGELVGYDDKQRPIYDTIGNSEKQIKLMSDTGDDVVVVTRKEEQRDDENIERIVTLNDKVVLDDVTYLLPWKDNQDDYVKLYHWNLEGGVTTWELTSGFENETEVIMYELSDQGRINKQVLPVINGTVTIIAEEATPYVIVKADGTKELVSDFGECDYVVDPGFNGYEEGDKLDSEEWSGDITDESIVVERSKNPSTGDQRLAFNSPEKDVTVSTTIRGLTEGRQYVAEVNIQNDSEAKAYIGVDIEDETVSSNYTEESIIGNYVKCDAKNGSKMQRMQIFFTAEGETATLTLTREAGEGSTYVDDIRIVDVERDHGKTAEHWSKNEEGQSVFTQDFEVVVQGLYPFVLSSAQGISDPATHLSQLNAPYTQAGWNNRVIDDVIEGEWSLKHHDGNTGIIYQTIPANFRFEAGKTYKVEFDYQSGPDKAYAMVVGDGLFYTSAEEEDYLEQARGETKHVIMEVTGSSSGQTWIGLYERGSHNLGDIIGYNDKGEPQYKTTMGEIDFVLDNLVITQIGEVATVSLDKTTIYLGETAKIIATQPEETTWENSDPTVVKVDTETQTVKALKKGTATLTATLPGGEKVEFTITVKNSIVSDIPRTEYPDITATANTEEMTGEGSGNGHAIHAVDGSTSTFWHNQWSSPAFTPSETNPAVLTVDLGKEMEIGGFKFLQRMSNVSGVVHNYSYRALAADGVTVLAQKSVALSEPEKDNGVWIINEFEEIVTAKYIEISVTAGGNSCSVIAEVEPISVEFMQLEKLTAPTANIASGVVAANTQIELSAEKDATIYYTTDGTEPTTASNKYVASIEIAADTTIKAIAVKEGYTDSAVATFEYTLPEEGTAVYTVTFNSDGGTAVPTQTVTGGGTVTEPTEPTKTGYKFLGWFVPGEGENAEDVKYDFTNATATANITLTAKWEKIIIYTVTFDSNGGSAVKALELKAGEAVVEPEKPTKTGYEFLGWFVPGEGENAEDVKYDFTNATATANITLTAKWSVDTRALDKAIEDYSKVEKGVYTDKSWNTFTAALVYAQSVADNKDATPNAVTYAKATLESAFAGLTETTYRVIFDSNGGSTVATQTIVHGQTVTEPADPTRDGYNFQSWYILATEEGEQDVEYDFETPVTEDITLTAKWDLDKEALQALYDEHKNDVQDVYTDDSWAAFTKALEDAKKALDEATTPREIDAARVALNLALMGLTEIKYTVSFNSAGGSEVTEQTIVKNQFVTQPTDPTKAGYHFAGWYLGDAAETYAFKTTPVIKDMILTAKWTVDKTSLQALYDAHKGDTQGIYTDASWTAFTTALAGAQTALTNATTAEEIAAAVEALNTAIAGLTNQTYTVTFDSDGGSAVDAQTIVHGQNAAKPADPTKDGYNFLGWYIKATEESAEDVEYNFETPVTGAITLTAKWERRIAFGEIEKDDQKDLDDVNELKELIWVSGIEDKDYNGGKRTQEFRVYDGNKKLVEGVDYTVSYKNNTNVYECVGGLDKWDAYIDVIENEADAEEKGLTEDGINKFKSKAPQVVLKMKGIYTGTKNIYFKINPADITAETADGAVMIGDNFVLDNLKVTKAKKAEKPAVTVLWKETGKNLKLNKDYTLEVKAKDGSGEPLAKVGEAGEYALTITGKGNFTGTYTGTYEVVEAVALNKAKVKVNKVDWKTAVTLSDEDFAAKVIKEVKVGNKLTLGTDYKVTEITNKDTVGTGYLTMEGLGSYVGSKTVAYTITGISMSKVKDAGKNSGYEYTGDKIQPLIIDEDLKITYKEDDLVEPTEETEGDYSVTYQKNVNKGTATMLLTGNPKKGYTGTKKVTFKITAYDLKARGVESIALAEGNNNQAEYTTGGATPEVVVKDKNGNTLKEGVDYTLSYKNNKAVTKEGVAKPMVTVKGKGNYAKTTELEFSIVAKDVTAVEGISPVTISVKDKAHKKGKNNWKPSFKVLDENNKAINKNEYTVTYALNGEEVKLEDKKEAALGDKITLTVTFKGGNYTGVVSADYRMIDKTNDISKAKVKINGGKAFAYTGNPIELKAEHFKGTTLNKNEITLGKEFKIVKIENNTNKGTAKVTIRGQEVTKEDGTKVLYGGEKTVTFRIGARSVVDSWWADLMNKAKDVLN